MASSLQYYSVSITNGFTGTSPSDGFIDAQRTEKYYPTINGLETTPSGLNLALSTAKRRGNIRYHEIIRQLQLVSNFLIDPNSITATNATALLEPTVFAFQMIARSGNWTTRDEVAPPAILTGTACIRRCIARALTVDIFRQVDIFDPTASASVPTGSTSVPRFGPRINLANTFEIGPYATTIANAESVIAVTLLH